MSYLTVKQKSMDRLKIQESEILESLQGLKQKILKSDLRSKDKIDLDTALLDFENAIKDYFLIEYITAKKIGNS